MSVNTSYVRQMHEINMRLIDLDKMLEIERGSSFQGIKEQSEKIDLLFLELATTLGEIKIEDANLEERLQQLHTNYDDLQKKVEQIAKIHLSPPINYEERLQQWVDHAGGKKKARQTVQRQILDFWKDLKKNDLKFDDLDIEDLPDVFDHPACVQRLLVFRSKGCKLKELPKTIGNLITLEQFYCRTNPFLAALPESIVNCISLKLFCCISNRSLTIIPENIGNLIALEEFIWTDNPLSTKVPDSIVNCRELRRFWCFENPLLRELPENIGNLIALEEFQCSQNPLLRELPESIVNCRKLMHFHCSRNPSLRELPENMGNLIALEVLDCSDNPLLRELPKSIVNCRGLKNFYCCRNPSLRELPENIGNLIALEVAEFSGNPLLREFPESIVNCTSLAWFNCSGCKSLYRLPNGITNLSKGCRVILERCSFSGGVMGTLRAVIDAEGYAGPNFIYSKQRERRFNNKKSIIKYLDGVYEKAQIEKTALSTLIANTEYRSYFKEWLKRLSFTAEGGVRAVEETKYRGFYRAIVQNLELAERDPKFRGAFWNAVVQGSTNCGDRIALSVVDLGIRQKGAQVLGKGTKDTWDYLKQRLALTILDKCAKDKASKMKFCDEIEVHLAFVLEVWKRLDLPPLDITEMLFLRYLKEEDFDNAAEKVHSAWNNHPLICDYLLDQPEWLPALYIDHPNEMQAFEEAKLRMEEIKKEITRKAKDLSEQEFAEDPLSQEYTNLESFAEDLFKQLTIDAILVIGGMPAIVRF